MQALDRIEGQYFEPLLAPKRNGFVLIVISNNRGLVTLIAITSAGTLRDRRTL